MNHELPDDHAADDWFHEVQLIAVAIGGIAAAIGRTFVLCLADTKNGTVEDFASLAGDRVELEKLRLALEEVHTDGPRNTAMTRGNHDRAPTVYADFHKAHASPWTPGLWAVPLVCSGTFDDLCRLGLRLVEGLALAPSMEDVEYDGIARYDHERRRWCIEFDEATLREGSDAGCCFRDFLCWSCSQPAQWHGLGSEGRCQHCGADLGALWAPPD